MSEDLAELIEAVARVEGTVNGLRGDFDKKTAEDIARFEKLEANVASHSATLVTHAELHTSHARMITKASELAIRAAEKSEEVRTEAQTALRSALDKHAISTENKLDALAVAGTARTELLDKIVKWQKNPFFKAAWFIGGVIGGAIAAYLAAH